MAEYETREDGKPYATRVIEESVCAYCGASITQRAEGRRRIFCDSTCRSGSYRGSKPRMVTQLGRASLRDTKRV